MEGYTKENGCPSECTLWNISNNCPASQRKSLAGLDNVASDGSDSFNKLIKICRTLEDENVDNFVKKLTESQICLKGNCRAHCMVNDCQGVADHCIKYALPDVKQHCYQEVSQNIHDRACGECESLSQALNDVKNLIKNTEEVTDVEREDLHYDAAQAVQSILLWKAHILTTVNQDIAKQLILEKLDDSTAFIITDFAMKFLAHRYRESMRSWFGKAGNGMHVSCVIMKDNSTNIAEETDESVEEKFKKRMNIAFIGKAAQDAGSVIAIYQSLLQQVQTDFPQIKFIIDKSDNAGCYHKEVLFTWKATWPRNT